MSAKVVPLHPVSQERSNEELAFAAAQGDGFAIGQFFDRNHQMVFRYALRILMRRDDAEDVTQSVFLKIAEGKAKFEGRSSASTWLLGVTTNVIRHYRRSLARRLGFHERLSDVLKVGGGPVQEDAQAEFGARQELALVRRALARQSEKNRIAFVLCEVEGLSAKEAAAILGASETAVWKRVSTARKGIKRALEQA